MLLQEVFTWGLSTRIGRLGDNRVPGRVEGIPPGERITKVSRRQRVNNDANHRRFVTWKMY